MKDLLGREYPDYLNSFGTEYGQTLRVNRLKAEPADIVRRFLLTTGKEGAEDEVSGKDLLEPVPWCPEGFYYQGEERLSLHPWYHAGVYYLQDPSAMAPAAYLPARPGDRVLDLCAAPGGKSTALAGKLQGEGILVANDISASRCKALLKNLEMAGVANMLITCETPERLADRFPGYFDAILVDAPCSGEGMFRKDPSMMKSWSPEEVCRYSMLQKEILSYAYAMLGPGGYLLYSTCTYSPEEDEEVVNDFISKYPDMKIVPIDDPSEEEMMSPEPGQPEWVRLADGTCGGSEELKYCKRFWNHKVRGEGQFAALLRKDGEASRGYDLSHGESADLRPDPDTFSRKFSRKGKEGRKEDRRHGKKQGRKQEPDQRGFGNRAGLRDRGSGRGSRKGTSGYVDNKQSGEEAAMRFLSDADAGRLFDHEERLMRIGDQLYLLPKTLPPAGGLRIVRSGLLLGEIRKNRFEPSQALAMALHPEEYARVWNLTSQDDDVKRYLKGESIPCPVEKGYVLVCADGYPLGWGKCNGSRLINKYKPGWRAK